MKWGLEDESGKGKSGIRGNAFKCGGRISERVQIEMRLSVVKECGFETTRYWMTPEDNPSVKLPVIYGKCSVHQTVSNHRFQDPSDAFRFFRCDPLNRTFIFVEKSGALCPFTGDMTELAYRVHSAFEDSVNADYEYLIFEIKTDDDGNVHFQPVNVNHISTTERSEDDYSYTKLQITNSFDGEEITTVTIRIDWRA